MKSFSANFINTNTLCDESDEENKPFNSETNDPLQGLGSEAILPKRIDNVVFAEPLEKVLTKEDSLKDKEEMVFIDNVVVHKKSGRKYKKYHMNIEDATQLKCPQSNCTRIFSTSKLLKAHIRKVHCADRNRYICECCGRGFSALYLLERHAAVHSGERVACPVCHVLLSCSTGLTNHLRSHSKVRPHQCSVCSKSFARASNLATHVKFVHRNGLLDCGVCDMRFSSRKQWSLHMKNHKKTQHHTDNFNNT
uniref:C2H2-type domain-containing protein n=1 Tax=Heliothis virescens TaxID=7102 RepID=A0A2A4JII2_HELVI